MSFTAAELNALKAAAPRRGVFMRLDTVPVVRCWLGVGNIKPGVNALDPVDGAVYRGFGEILDMPAFQQLCDGSAERLSFIASGIPPTVFADIAPLMTGQQVAIAGKAINAGYALFDYDWQMLGPVRWSWDGTADFLRAARPAVQDAGAPDVWTIELSAGSWLTQRKRPALSYFTQPDQAARSAILNPGAPTDLFSERTPFYETDFDKTWPSFPS